MRRETNPCGREAFQSLMKTYANKTERPGWLRSGVSSSAIECGSGTGTPEEGDGKRAWVRGLREGRGGGPDSLRWFWSLTVNGPMTRSDRVATLEEAKAQFQKSWECLEAWAKLEEVPSES